MEVIYIVEIAIILALLLVSLTIKLVTRRITKNMEGFQGMVKKKNSKGKIIAKN